MTPMAERLNNTKLGIPFGHNTASNVIYADNVTLLAGSRENLNERIKITEEEITNERKTERNKDKQTER